MFAKEQSRSVKYEIVDNFFSFWFRFVYKYKSAIEIGNFEFVKDIVRRDFSSFSGRFLERYFIEKLKSEARFSSIGTYWESKNQNEIDIVAMNSETKELLFAEVKLNKNKIDLEVLKQKSQNITQKYKGYKIEYVGYGLEDM
jgi:AAA+ ATPase superfamily predicted ATPase